MTNLELLSPARNLECGIAAIDHGADAVYIGANKFGARSAVGNSIEDIEALCHYAHQFSAKVYVTINTIVYDHELSEAIELVRELQRIGVDAILVQDIGLLTLLKKYQIGITLHASTQTDNRTIEKVQWLRDMGVKRVVLARELSIEEIGKIHNAVPDIELEVFVHGALCVCYSGLCYASQYCFNRSANRGECAQFCRMPFDLIDADGNIIEHSKHLLSLRDMAQLYNISDLAEAGATSFKIEGRLKPLEYVKNVTAAYSERLNEFCIQHKRYRRASMGYCKYSFIPDIRKSFNRGFTTYFAKGREHPMASMNTPKSLGEQIGKVKEVHKCSFTVASTKEIHNGDGLCFFNEDNKLVGFRINRAEGNQLYPVSMPKELKIGVKLFRNHSQAFNAVLSKPSAVRKIQISMTLEVNNNFLSLTIIDEYGNKYSSSLPYEPQTAIKPQEDNIKKVLSKLGNTIYECVDVSIITDISIPFIQSSLLAELRRNTIDGFRSKNILSSEDDFGQLPKPHINKQSGFPQYNKNMPSYLYNASNKEARAFFYKQKIQSTAFETITKSNLMSDNTNENIHYPIMQCRYCLKAELGFCNKHGKRSQWHEPLTLHLNDGKRFILKFDCKDCEMQVLI